MKLEAYILDVTYRELATHTLICLICKTAQGKVCLVERYDPYFYVQVDNERVKESIQTFANTEVAVAKVEEIEKNIDGVATKLLKVFGTHPKDIPKLKEALKDSVVATYETDILFQRRYLIDNSITPLTKLIVEGKETDSLFHLPTYTITSKESTSEALEELNVVALDIETHGKTLNPEKNPILMVALYGKKYKKVITWKPIKAEHVEVVEGEAALISRLQQILQELQPDIITGYFSDGFDLPYILTRAKKHKMSFTYNGQEPRLSRGGEQSVSITSLPHIDILKLIRKTIGRNLATRSYSLNDVAFEVLGEQKKEVDIEKLHNAWDTNDESLTQFVEYNLHDAYLTYQLFNKLLPQLEEMVRMIGLLPYDVSRMAFSQLVEWFIIKQTPSFNEIIENKPGHEELAQRQEARLKGAYVYQPTPGVYQDVVVCDFMSLYPTIISAHNVSAASLRKGKKTHVNPENEKIWFGDEPGFTAIILEDIIKRRMRIKAILKEKPDDKFLQARVQTLKLLANSFYGYLGFYAARWYCFACAETTTAYARHYIKEVIGEVKKSGLEVLYSDTDSVFIGLGSNQRKEALKIVEKINETLPGLMELEYEGYYPAALFVQMKGQEGGAKKRYALMDTDNNLKVVGFEAVRRNVSPIAKKTQEAVLRIILGEQDKEKALRYVQNVLEKLQKKAIPKEELIITTKLSRSLEAYDAIGPHVAVAQKMQEKGEEVGAGSVISYIIDEKEGIIRDKATIPDEAKSYDADYYINNQVVPAVEKIFEVINYSKEDILGEGKQSDLSSFI